MDSFTVIIQVFPLPPSAQTSATTAGINPSSISSFIDTNIRQSYCVQTNYIENTTSSSTSEDNAMSKYENDPTFIRLDHDNQISTSQTDKNSLNGFSISLPVVMSKRNEMASNNHIDSKICTIDLESSPPPESAGECSSVTKELSTTRKTENKAENSNNSHNSSGTGSAMDPESITVSNISENNICFPHATFVTEESSTRSETGNTTGNSQKNAFCPITMDNFSGIIPNFKLSSNMSCSESTKSTWTQVFSANSGKNNTGKEESDIEDTSDLKDVNDVSASTHPFHRNEVLNLHENREHETPQIKICEICKLELTSSTNYEQHLSIHEAKKPYECPVCSKRFRMKFCMTSHSLEHPPERHFTCSVCKKTFKTRKSLTQHRHLHIDPLVFKCEHCEKPFKFHSNLLQHMLVHSNKRQHKCETCGKKFKLPHHLKKHILTHKKMPRIHKKKPSFR